MSARLAPLGEPPSAGAPSSAASAASSVIQLHRASRAARASRASRARASTSSPRIARVITVPLPPTHPHARAATAAALARSIARAMCGGCGGGCGRWRWRAVTSTVTHVTRADRHAHARVCHHCASRASSPFSVSPRTTGTRALLRRRRSLARSRACGVALAVEVAFSYIARHARASRTSRARVCTSSPRIARVITAPLPRCHPCARAAAAAALSRLLACSRARRRRRTVIRTSCVSRASRARARASSSSRHLLAPLPLKCAPFAAVSSSLLSSLSSSLSSSLRARITTKRPATCE